MMEKTMIKLKDFDTIRTIYSMISTNNSDEKFFIFTKNKDMMFDILCHIAFECFGIEKNNGNKRKLLSMYLTDKPDCFSESLFNYYNNIKKNIIIFTVSKNNINLHTIYSVICGLCNDNKCNVIMDNLMQFYNVFSCKKVDKAIFTNIIENEVC